MYDNDYPSVDKLHISMPDSSAAEHSSNGKVTGSIPVPATNFTITSLWTNHVNTILTSRAELGRRCLITHPHQCVVYRGRYYQDWCSNTRRFRTCCETQAEQNGRLYMHGSNYSQIRILTVRRVRFLHRPRTTRGRYTGQEQTFLS